MLGDTLFFTPSSKDLALLQGKVRSLLLSKWDTDREAPYRELRRGQVGEPGYLVARFFSLTDVADRSGRQICGQSCDRIVLINPASAHEGYYVTEDIAAILASEPDTEVHVIADDEFQRPWKVIHPTEVSHA